MDMTQGYACPLLNIMAYCWLNGFVIATVVYGFVLCKFILFYLNIFTKRICMHIIWANFINLICYPLMLSMLSFVNVPQNPN